MSHFKKIMIGIIITIVIVSGMFALFIYRTGFVPIDSNDETAVRYRIETGMTPRMITQELEDVGLIRNAMMANIIIRLNGWSTVQAGEYELSQALTLEEMFQKFESGDVAEARHRVTIPEGARLSFIAEVLAPVVGMDAEALLERWNDPELLQILIEDYWFLTEEILNKDLYYALEGYFYPLTYEFRDELYDVEEVTRELLDVTEQRLEILRESIETSEFTVHELLTFAAIIEGETQDNSEMANVSGVFHNRLAINMMLQTDVTVQYIADERNVRVDNEMLRIESPFNTYQNFGLPPGPVNSPSVHAIEAAMYPATHEYYFFISDMFNCVDGGKHYFTNFNDHLEFFNNYLLPSYEAGESVCR